METPISMLLSLQKPKLVHERETQEQEAGGSNIRNLPGRTIREGATTAACRARLMVRVMARCRMIV